MHRPIFMAAAFVLFLACGTEESDTPAAADTVAVKTDTATAAASPYFPVYDFIRNEIEYVDSLPVGIMKHTTTDKKKDSAYIRLEEFHQLANEFLTPELKQPQFQKEFKETSFFDKTTSNATFFYNSTDTSTTIKRIDVVTNKGDVYDEVKSLYIEKTSLQDGREVVKKLYWKPKRNFQIITVNRSGNEPSNQLIKVVWDNRE